jgi:C-terminal processing protease CtpA/Prc
MVVALAFASACRSASPPSSAVQTLTPPRVASLRAFARLYGVIRWFHPSDAAAAVDWDRLAVEGVRRVIEAPDPGALRTALDEIFTPIAPTVHIAARGESFPDEAARHPAGAASLDVVAWEHKGYGDTAVPSGYASKRRHRKQTVAVRGFPFASLWQAVDAAPYRGSLIRLRGKLRTASAARGQLWLRIERGDATGFSDDMSDRPVVNDAWTTAEVSGPVDTEATRIVFGIRQVTSKGTVWYDDLELAAQAADGTSKAIEITNPGFEAGDPLATWKPGIGVAGASFTTGWSVGLDHDRAASGNVSLRTGPATEVTSKELFDDAPQPGETVDIDLGSGLRARVPIALYSRNGQTIGDDPAAARRSQAGARPIPQAGYDVIAGIADVVVAWNVLQHFWPYWDAVPVDWSAELDTALRDAVHDRSVDDHIATLQRLAAAAPDAHARIGCPGKRHQAMPPFAVDVVEGRIVVTASADSRIVPGDVIVSVNGRPADVQLNEYEALASGSPQFRTVRARWRFGNGPPGSRLTLTVRRGNAALDVAVTRNDETVSVSSGPAFRRFDDGTYYIDLSRVSMGEIDAAMTQLAGAPGVVFDLREPPNGGHMVLPHLLTRPDDAKEWLRFPHVIRPDHGPTSTPTWDTEGWELPVLQPHIAGRVAFLVGPATASYGESIVGIVEHYRLGELVGSATAGANGNFAQIAEPSGCTSTFTGLRVTKLDGSRLHLLGFRPTIPATSTIAGIIAGRDEVLEKALAYVRTGAK